MHVNVAMQRGKILIDGLFIWNQLIHVPEHMRILYLKCFSTSFSHNTSSAIKELRLNNECFSRCYAPMLFRNNAKNDGVLDKGGGTHAARLCVNLRLQLSNRIADSAKYVPNDFNRKPRPLIELDRYKATEFRFIVLYLGPIVLKGMLSQNYYKHFLLFHCAIRILSTVKFIDTAFINTAKELLIYFVQNCENFYGTDFCVYNTHSLIHLADDVKYHKEVLDELSCFIFENFWVV
ncbi:unnamed protein product [Tenebrio molitor]|nr:unnamed protein product [Tenebrio molitor]